MRGKRLLVVLSVVCALLVTPAIAAAQGGAGFERDVFINGSAKLGDGMHFYIGADDGGPVGVTVDQHLTRSYQGVYYSARAKASVHRDRVQGRIGDRGRIRMRFEQRGRREVRKYGPDSCLRVVTIPGRLVGKVRFRGEGGYVDVRERRLRGSKFIVNETDCAKALEEARRARTPATLTACRGDTAYQAEAADGQTSLVAFGPDRRSGGLRSGSYISRAIRPGAFSYADDFSAATLRPPAPFRGAATYADGAIAGDLRWRALSGERIDLAPASDATLAVSDRHACVSILKATVAANLRASSPTERSLQAALMRRALSGR